MSAGPLLNMFQYSQRVTSSSSRSCKARSSANPFFCACVALRIYSFIQHPARQSYARPTTSYHQTHIQAARGLPEIPLGLVSGTWQKYIPNPCLFIQSMRFIGQTQHQYLVSFGVGLQPGHIRHGTNFYKLVGFLHTAFRSFAHWPSFLITGQHRCMLAAWRIVPNVTWCE